MSTRSAIGVGFLLGQLANFVLIDVLPNLLVPRLARRWL